MWWSRPNYGGMTLSSTPPQHNKRKLALLETAFRRSYKTGFTCCRGGLRPLQQRGGILSLVELLEVEIARRVRQLSTILLLKEVPDNLDLELVGGCRVAVVPKLLHAHVAGPVNVAKPDLLTFILVAPGAVSRSRWAATLAARLELFAPRSLTVVWHLWAGPWQAVPNCSRVVGLVLRKRKRTKVVASNVVAIVLPIPNTGWPGTVSEVERHTHTKVHASIDQRLRRLHGHLEAADPLDAELVARAVGARDHFVLNVPHDPRQVPGVHVEWRVAAVPLCSVHMKGKEVGTAGTV